MCDALPSGAGGACGGPKHPAVQTLKSQIRTDVFSRRGLFATHYHRLAEEHALDPGVAIRHMACAVTPPGLNGEPEAVTFLYKLAEGAPFRTTDSDALNPN